MHPRVLDRARSVLLVIDVQEAYRGQTFDHDGMVRGVRQLIQAARVVDVPVLATEQYPKGLGHLLPEVQELLSPGTPVIEKMSISCCGSEEFGEKLAALKRRQILVCGIETHACVSQTSHDLLGRDYQVHVAHDAISSRFEKDHRIGWEKLIGSGAVPTTVELACLEWVRTAAAPEFKAIHKIIK
jgi:nicotinamidase-related amidase